MEVELNRLSVELNIMYKCMLQKAMACTLLLKQYKDVKEVAQL